MSLATHPPESDLWLPLEPPRDAWNPHAIHTHYFGFSIPDAQIGAFLYVRYQPAFPLSQGGVVVFRGLDNHHVLDAEHVDYEMTMPWPSVDGSTIETKNGLRIEFLEPGRVARVTYASQDGACRIDVTQPAVSPLLVRGHIMPGEESHHGQGTAAGGSEQFMHVTGTLELHGEQYEIDGFHPRDRSWSQTRVERRGAVASPPVGWTPMHFGEDLVFNQISIEHPESDPGYESVYDVPADRRTHHFAWIVLGDETRAIDHVRRVVHERHPTLHAAIRQEIEAVDATGVTHRFSGEAIAMSPIPAWPNVAFNDSVYRWEDEQGRVTHSTYQEIWFGRYQRAIARRVTAHV